MENRRARELLRDSVNTLIAQKKLRHRQLVAEGAVSNGVLSRLRHAEDNTGVDHLDGIARAAKVKPWQLLHPDPLMVGLSEKALEAAAFVNSLPVDRQASAVELLLQLVAFHNRPPLQPMRFVDSELGAGPAPSEDTHPAPGPGPTSKPARNR